MREKRGVKEGAIWGSCYERRRRDGTGVGVVVEEKKRTMKCRGRESDEDNSSAALGSWLDPRHV